MLNPCEGVFSTLKSQIKDKIRVRRQQPVNFKEYGQMAKFYLKALQKALKKVFEENIITAALVQQHFLHCVKHMAYAKQGQPMKMEE